MKKTGFVIKVKAKDKEYYYIRRSIWKKKENGKAVSANINILSLGTKSKALESLKMWESNINNLPDELKSLNFGMDDVKYWLEQVENK